MTHDQFEDPAHSSVINGTTSSSPVCAIRRAANPQLTVLLLADTPNISDQYQHAPIETTPTMSSHGLLEDYVFSEHRTSGEWIVQDGVRAEEDSDRRSAHSAAVALPERSRVYLDDSYRNGQPNKRARVQFYDFAAQARLQQYHERRRHHLQARKRALQRSIALSARLRRTSSWVQDGLVEISKHQDPKAFAQAFSHAQDLVDNCFSFWNNELNNMDAAQAPNSPDRGTIAQESFFEQLQPEARNDLLLLLSNLRSNPGFLISRLRTLPRSQVATLTSSPKWQFSDAFLNSFSQDSGRSGSQRKRQLQTYSRELEDYATSLERTNPLSFLLHNIYSHDINPDSSESQLRLYNWSTICATLMETGADSYSTLYGQVLEAFASMQDWPAKTRVEIFLMDVLQRGAFLINDNPLHRAMPGYNPLKTEQARNFFNEAVHELYVTLIECGPGCFPPGALALAQAILGKLSSTDDQSVFRGHFMSEWYLSHFLKAAIMFPENENMLLKMHVSKKAREYILAPIYNMFVLKYENSSQEPTNHYDENICNIILHMVNMLESLPSDNPYEKSEPLEIASLHQLNSDNRILVVCASEVVKTLEILSPQTMHSSDYSSDPVLRSIGDAWEQQVQIEWPKTKFDWLKQQLSQLLEPGVTAKDVHPCLESWAEFNVDGDGNIDPVKTHKHAPNSLNEEWTQTLNFVQKAALRLCSDSISQPAEIDTAPVPHWTQTSTLRELFEQEMSRSQAETRMVDTIFWKNALDMLDTLYHRPRFLEAALDDTNVLSRPFELLSAAREKSMSECHSLDDRLGSYESSYKALKNQVRNLMSGLEELRLKLWYTSQVINSAVYHDARNVASALSHMAMPVLQNTINLSRNNREQLRPSTSRSSRSSIFGEPQSDTMKLLKAPTEHGGPRKLADEQIENIKSWLKQYSIDNFCISEERLHRFCMEVQLVTKKLTGETMSQSPDLWSSELFFRERVSYDVHNVGVSSAPASTRPSSVYSEAAFSLPRPILRSSDSDVRSVSSDERSSMRRASVYSIFPRGGLNTQLLMPELASSISSYGGRGSSATTSNSDIFSQPVQSVTSASVYSRTSSILYGSLPDFSNRPPPALKEKKKFREQLRKGLVCLLLSDLGSMVWSWGCETDKWVEDAQNAPSVKVQFLRRMTTDALVHREKDITLSPQRRKSADGRPALPASPTLTPTDEAQPSTEDLEDIHLIALRDILSRMGKQIDPAAKLQACLDFYAVAQEQMKLKWHRGRSTQPNVHQRRPSLESLRAHDYIGNRPPGLGFEAFGDSLPTESQIVDHLKRQLAELKPTRIFRDLQFTAVFAPPEMLDKHAAGKAFMHLGMAALEYKSELCGSMVDVADQLMASDIAKNSGSPQARSTLTTAAHYWRIAALERNCVAQRELALLYLMHPEILPVVTLPLATSSDIFQDDMMWQKRTNSTESRQALCLALHWMLEAAKNGDEVAKGKLAERKETYEQEQGLSIR